jgi:lipopolysaccharide transport system permease protein
MISALRVANKPRPVGETWTRITPGGVERPRRTLQRGARELSMDLSRILTITRAEMKATYFGKSLGWIWLLVDPLLMALVYYFQAAVLYQLIDKQHFIEILVAIVFWVWFLRSVSNAPLMFTSYASLLRDTDFPITMLLGVTLAKDIVVMFFNFLVALAFILVFQIALPQQVAPFGLPLLAFPLVLLVEALLILPTVMLLSIAGVFIKDLSGILAQVIPIVWYLSPILYPPATAQARLPHFVVRILNLNPFSYILTAFNDILVRNQWPDFYALGVVVLATLVPTVVAFYIFHRARYFYYTFL